MYANWYVICMRNCVMPPGAMSDYLRPDDMELKHLQHINDLGINFDV